MRHIINLIGPPVSGKSTIIRELKTLLPVYHVLAINDFRRRQEETTPDRETTAWNQLWLEALKSEYCIIESTGTSPHLGMILDRLWRAPGTNILTVALKATPRIRRQREEQRRWSDYQQLPHYEAPSGRPWRPVSGMSIAISVDTGKLLPAQTAALLFEQLPADFLE
ncbi:AAA family ATPase [Runella sp.]|uniref:AAA family ATPase n=1 Tax=Runella sp. TaxID=1960881 RepID=UPI003D13A89F